jgi:TPP-dependent pyruvate/acetoin dehydrogenase alpha subunit
VGTTIPTAVGYAYAFRYQGKDSVVASFFGDGASEEGVFYESLNFAALKKLPIIFICENNSYAIHTHQSCRQVKANLCERVESFDIPTIKIEGNDVMKIYNTVREIRSKLHTAESGPHFIECETYRWKEHVGPNEDYELGYRTREELKPWLENDQVEKIGILLNKYTREQIEQAVDKEIEEAINFAEKSNFPNLSDLNTDVFQN